MLRGFYYMYVTSKFFQTSVRCLRIRVRQLSNHSSWWVELSCELSCFSRVLRFLSYALPRDSEYMIVGDVLKVMFSKELFMFSWFHNDWFYRIVTSCTRLIESVSTDVACNTNFIISRELFLECWCCELERKSHKLTILSKAGRNKWTWLSSNGSLSGFSSRSSHIL